MKVSPIRTFILFSVALGLTERHAYAQEPRDEARKISVATVQSKSVPITQQYTCGIHSHHHIEVRAPEDGYLQEVAVQEGQAVKQGELMFKFASVLQQAKLDFELAEVQIAQLEFNNVKRLFDTKIVSQDEVQLLNAKLAKAKAKADMARAELNFTDVNAPFDGMVDLLPRQQGSLVLRGETLTNLYDNKVVRAYFNMPESRYLAYMAEPDADKARWEIELTLADNSKFPQAGKINAIEAKFNAETGNIAFRADFPNPDGLLRHGQSATVRMRREWNAIVIPQRATFEDHSKRYVFLVDKDNIAHRREVVIQAEILDDLFVIKKGVVPGDKIVVDGIRAIRDGEKVKDE